uniref:Uncharacterized protein n=1 Tax=Aegilops tauschii subsp. strangulata TaxID=200361 RepID=A0A453G4D1_AEGTS
LRRPILEGDNWWRGHAAAFLKYVNVPPEVLRKGRVSQVNRHIHWINLQLFCDKSKFFSLLLADKT